ncbi:FIMAH domain-containing protein [Paenibacillus flagellatus]|nr:metallophosphoesterase [Paenibacillus flagellatus]
MIRNKRIRNGWIVWLVLAMAVAAALPAGAVPARAADAAGNVPPILITELVPDTANVNGADGYEFIELFNQTDGPIRMNDYRMLYRYLESETVWELVPDDVVLESGRTLVLWIINAYNTSLTVADFNAHFGTSLTENVDIVRIYSGGMANTRMRELVVATNTGHEIVSAFYNEGSEITAPDKGIFYRYPSDGGRKMALIGGGTDPATPGRVEPGQVPGERDHVGTDETPPQIADRTGKTEADPEEPLELVAEARDETGVKTLELHYKPGLNDAYTTVNLTAGRTDGLYRAAIDFWRLLGHPFLDYYFTASDGTQVATSETFRIDLGANPPSPRIDWKAGSFAKGEAVVKATANGVDPETLKLSIDGAETGGAYRELEKRAYLLFEANGMNGKNAVTIGRDVVYMADAAVNLFGTVAAPIEPAKLKEGANRIALRAGSNVRPYFEDDPETNLDDFDVRNVRLVLSDGTVIRSAEYPDPAALLDLGDNGRFFPVAYFTFELPREKLASLAYRWDTTAAADGLHRIRAASPDGRQAEIDVQVDNTAPLVRTSIEAGRRYKGAFSIEAFAEDAVSGLKRIETALDGKPIATPYPASSTVLMPGDHTLSVRAEDNAGNVREVAVPFSTPEEHPERPALIAPSDGEKRVALSPTLQVRAADPTGDPMKVDFRVGYAYGANDAERVSLFAHATEWEPPSSGAPAGERPLTAEERASLSASDDRYMATDSTDRFPYLRMQVELDEDVAAGSQVEVVWEGHSLPGRKVTMYAWNNRTSRWDAVDSYVPGSGDDFTLRGTVNGGDYVRDRVVNVLVQDRIPSRGEYDYTFVWMSDTQFYSELYPHIYETQVNWIKERADDMNIRYVVHTGDLVNEPTADYQWERADRYMNVLDAAGIPYGVLAGNHDVGTTNSDYATYSRYFGADRFEGKPYYAESYENNRGHYDLVSANGNDFLFLYMGWSIGEAEIAWMNRVLAEHPDRIAIVCLHDYLQPAGTRSATGNVIYDKVVRPNPNVRAVFSGHYTGSALLTDELDDDGDGAPDRKVYQMLNDYQGHEEGGMGYMKLLHFDAESGSIYVNTYSPYKDDYNYYDQAQDEHELVMNLTPTPKRVATDYVQARLYTDRSIGAVADVASGQVAEVVWTGLAGGRGYSWYAAAEDAFGGRAVSDIWSFRTVETIEPPAELRAVSITDTTVALAWKPVAGTEGSTVTYDVYRDANRIATVTGTVFEATGLAADTTYTFRVVARDALGVESEPSAPIEVTTLVSLASIRERLGRYIESGDVRGPLAVQLENALEKAEMFGERKQAAKALHDFLKHLNNPAMERHASAPAKRTLEEKTKALLAIWMDT